MTCRLFSKGILYVKDSRIPHLRVPDGSHVLRYLVSDTPSPCRLAEQAPYPASAPPLSCPTLTKRHLLEIADLTY
jgi:hypothetical protein